MRRQCVPGPLFGPGDEAKGCSYAGENTAHVTNIILYLYGREPQALPYLFRIRKSCEHK